MSTQRERKRPNSSFGNQGPAHENHRLGKVNWLRAAVLGAYVSGASVLRGALRVVAGGGLAMAVTSAIGHFFRVPGA